MRIVCLTGSPRKKSNSTKLANRFCKYAENYDTSIVKYNLNDLNYKGCQGCYACKTVKDKCVIKDDMQKILNDVFNCDVLLLASPVYYGDVTAQLKGFIDRTFSYLVPDYPTNKNKTRLKGNKKLVFCLTQGHPDESLFDDIYPKYSMFFKWLGFGESHLIRICDVDPTDDIENNSNAMNKVDDLVKKVLS